MAVVWHYIGFWRICWGGVLWHAVWLAVGDGVGGRGSGRRGVRKVKVERSRGSSGSGRCSRRWDPLQDNMWVKLRLGAVEPGHGGLQQTLLTPLVSSVLVSTEASCQVEGAVWSKTGVHPLGQVEDLRWREGFPFALLSLQPALAATGGALVSASDPSIFLGTVPAGSLLQTADEKGQGHGEDDNATNN